ncbi:hypothetical protein HG537_0D05310 [Torulaspora globosa]|uniref:Protein FAF1 n=1 Tax=Torulaspora globosa TaxID=48254 RepID=A0A7H9HT48_9SACH|nr:hypothetical protein HG537_0D05310 [Torulaspora sp. CBS 2947]
MSDDDRLLEIQRRAFESQFGSLESMGFQDKTKNQAESENENESENESDSENGSESESESDGESGEPQPRVIRFNELRDDYVPSSKKEQRLLRSGKPLRAAPDDDDERQNLKNDIELQRFLKESNLLSALDDSNAGKARSRTLEMRLRELSETNGSETKLNKLEKMPIQIRKGMVAKHLQRIKKHETEAHAGGVVLSRVKRGQFRKIDKTYRNDLERRIGTSIKTRQSLSNKPRQRGLKINTVGKSTRNGLVITKNEIARVNGHKRLK